MTEQGMECSPACASSDSQQLFDCVPCRGGSLTCSSSDGLATSSMCIAGSRAGRGCTPAVCRQTQEGDKGHRAQQRCPDSTQPSIAGSTEGFP
jgi:hypothetical protein